MRKFAVLIEKGTQNYSAYVPDLPGCIATGDSIDEVRQLIREGIYFHIDGLIQDGLPVPEPTTICECVEA
ncbi:MAG: type II toxin-antitoxin system HicB family antitoxin [Candidatus Hydrogenedentes bacterium]|nr:type II toxin-antitoxin system HicB family antitoxin [Candidatus Hydrogenedentota bacterium]